jgi:hypothetical protein
MRSFPIWLILGAVACGGTATVFDQGNGAGGDGGSGNAGAGASGGTGAAGGNGGAGASSSYDDCKGPGECQIAYDTCCGTCGTATLDDLAPINGALSGAYHQALCGDPPPPCPECAGDIPVDFFAYCEAGTCVEADVRLHVLSECNVASDCVLRWGLGCCEQCGTADPYYGGLVAVSTNGQMLLPQFVCGPLDGDCPPCVPDYPPEVSAECVAGHCVVVVAEHG